MTFQTIQDFLKMDLTHHYKKRKHVFNQAGIMVTARVVAMGLGAAGSIWAARCMGPRNYGLSGMVLSIVTQTSLAFGLIHPTVLIREYKNAEEKTERNELIRISATFSFLLSILFAVIGISIFVLGLFPNDYHFAGWFFAPLLILTTIQPIWVFQAAEHQHFQSMIAILQPFLVAVLYFMIFKPGMSAGADLAVNSCVCVVVTASYWFAIYRITPFRGSPFRWKDIELFGALIRKSGWFFISGLAIYVYTTLEQPLLGWLYSVEELGKYRTATQIAGAASSLFGMTVLLFFPRFLEWRKKGEEFLWRRQVKLGWLFGGIGCVGTLGAFILMPWVYPFLFGSRFTQAAIPSAILIASRLVVMVSGIFVWGLKTDYRFDKRISLFCIGTAFFSLISNLLFIPRFGMYATSITNLVSEMVIFLTFLVMSSNRIKIIRT